MLVGVLISIMISIVVGVSLIPTIVDSINTAKNTANAPAGLSGLLDVLSYVFVAVRSKIAALGSNPHRITSQIRRNLSSLWNMVTPSQAEIKQSRACVETRRLASLVDGGIVRHSLKSEATVRILLGAVALTTLTISAIMKQFILQTTLIRGKLKAIAHANPELKRELNPQRCRDYRGRLQSAEAFCGA